MTRAIAVLVSLLALASATARAQTPAAAPSQPATPVVPPASPAAPTPVAAPEPAASPAPSDALALEGIVVEPGGLTIDDAAKRALVASSAMGMKRAELEAAKARIRQTTIQFFPRLGLRASYTRLSEVESAFGGGSLIGAQNPGPLATAPCANGMGTCVVDAAGESIGAAPFNIPQVEDNYVLGASLTIPLSDYLLRLSDAAAGAQASKEAARLAIEAEERKVLSDARVMYLSWLRSHAHVHVAKQALERTRARLADARAAVEVGRLAQADALRIEALVANAALGVEQADAVRALIGGQLAIIMRDKGATTYQVGSGVPPLPALPSQGAPSPELAKNFVARALTQRQELKAIDATVRSFERGQDALIAGSYPRLDAVGDLTYANPNPRYFPPEDAWNTTWSAGLVLSFNVEAPFLSAAQGDELSASAERVRASRSGIEAQIVNEVLTALTDLRRAQAAMVAGETSVRAAEEAYRVRTDLFQVGRATASDIIDAESELLTAKLAITQARIDLSIAAEKLAYAVGPE